MIVCICTCTGETVPHIKPDGYNASLGQDPIEFRCVFPNETFSVEWVINGRRVGAVGEERGITEQIRDGDLADTVVVEARAENDNITLECLTFFLDALPAYSEEILLYIQGEHKINVQCGLETWNL